MPREVVRERPILFSGPMIRAILDGRKTQTRRIVRKPESFTNIRDCAFCCPHGVAGDRLWVRETWAWPGEEQVLYRADKSARDLEASLTHPHDVRIEWKPSIHMRRRQSRIDLEILSVRVERLQEISEADAKAEGVYLQSSHGLYSFDHTKLGGGRTARGGFEHGWDTINGKRAPWASNPFVWVVEFRRASASSQPEDRAT